MGQPPDHNTQRALADVISVIAWHKPLNGSTPTAELHVTVTFGETVIGEEDGSPVTFGLSLKEAEIVVILGNDNQVVPDYNTLDTTDPQTVKLEETNSRDRAGGVEGKLSLNPRKLSSSVSAYLTGKTSSKKSLTKIYEAGEISALHAKTHDGHLCWRLKSPTGEHLIGPVWKAAKEPRFTMIDKRSEKQIAKDNENGFTPEVRIEVRCRRHHINIIDPKIKDKSKMPRISHSAFDKNLAAAESFLRDKLMEVGLRVAGSQGNYTEVTFADVIAEQQ